MTAMMRRLLRPFLILLALLFLFEAWLWTRLEPMVAWVVALIPLERLKARIAAAIERLSPAATLNREAFVEMPVEEERRPSKGFSYSTKSLYLPEIVMTGSYSAPRPSAKKMDPSSNAQTSSGSPSRSFATSYTPVSNPHIPSLGRSLT